MESEEATLAGDATSHEKEGGISFTVSSQSIVLEQVLNYLAPYSLRFFHGHCRSAEHAVGGGGAK